MTTAPMTRRTAEVMPLKSAALVTSSMPSCWSTGTSQTPPLADWQRQSHALPGRAVRSGARPRASRGASVPAAGLRQNDGDGQAALIREQDRLEPSARR